MTRLRTLRSRLLLWVSGPLLALWVISTLVDHEVAKGFVNLNYDPTLLDTALDLGRSVREAGDRPYIDLPPSVIELLISGQQGRLYYRVNKSDGEYITGEPDIKPAQPSPTGQASYYDDVYRGHAVRVAAIRPTADLEIRSGGRD